MQFKQSPIVAVNNQASEIATIMIQPMRQNGSVMFAVARKNKKPQTAIGGTSVNAILDGRPPRQRIAIGTNNTIVARRSKHEAS